MKKSILYRKGQQGVLVGVPGAESKLQIQSAQSYTDQASQTYLDSKQNNANMTGSQKMEIQNTGAGGGGAPSGGGGGGSAPSGGGGGNYMDDKADFTKATQNLSTLNSAAPIEPGSDPRLMSTLSGAAAGAAAGSVVPGWGTAIGAVVGGAVGYFKGAAMKKKADKAYDEAIKKRKEEEAMFLAAKNSSLRKYESGKTKHFMNQASSLYGASGKTVGIARKGGVLYGKEEIIEYGAIPVKRVDFPVRFTLPKAAKGAKVGPLKDQVMLCSRPDGSCNLTHKSESPFHQPVFKRGGSVVNKMKRNIIPHGVLHEEENSTGVKGDKGIPIVQNGEKMFELERSELVLNADLSTEIQDFVYDYLKEPGEDKLLALGSKLRGEILLNTYSYDPEFAHLNH